MKVDAFTLVLDTERCTGHGRCYALAPELFADDEYGHGLVIGAGGVTPEQMGAAERAVAGCPEQAIALSARPGGA
jgi:ferredoxin